MTTEAEFRAKHEARAIEAMAKAIYDTRSCVEDPPWELLYPEDQFEYVEEAVAALAAYRAAMWMPMREAPKDRTPVLAHMRSDLQELNPGRDDLIRWNGVDVVISHSGVCQDGFDIGWSVAAPVGNGGLPDDWFIACQPLPLPPTEEPK